MVDVLIADEDINTWFRLNAVLRKHLIKATVVCNLAEAKQLLEKKPPTWLFVDEAFQNSHFPDLTRFVRARYPQVKIVSLVHQSVFPASQAGELIISKPLSPENMEAIIGMLL